jgi:hypothetical protein
MKRRREKMENEKIMKALALTTSNYKQRNVLDVVKVKKEKEWSEFVSTDCRLLSVVKMKSNIEQGYYHRDHINKGNIYKISDDRNFPRYMDAFPKVSEQENPFIIDVEKLEKLLKQAKKLGILKMTIIPNKDKYRPTELRGKNRDVEIRQLMAAVLD